jgi:hypothetical protein
MRRVIPLAVLGLAPLAPAQTVILDQTFNDADWSHAVLYSMGTVTLGPMAHSATGGNPGDFQQGRHTSQGAFAAIYDGHLFLPGVYSPATQGAIATVDISYDLIDFSVAGVQSGLLVLQSGHTYFRYVDSNDYAAWTTVGVNSIPGDDVQWQEASAAGISQGHPDFSATGAPITFGYYTFNWSLPQGFFIDRQWGLDNFRITIHGAQAACYANCDGSTAAPILNVSDFVCFQQRFAAGDSYANCDGSTAAPVLTVNDFVCFQQAFAAGCL